MVFSDYSCDKIMSLHHCCIALYLSWVPSPILCSCSEENHMTGRRASPLLEPDSGSTEKVDLPSLFLRSDMLPKLSSLICQHCPLSSPISFSSVLSFIISQIPQGCNGLQTPPWQQPSKASSEPLLRLGSGHFRSEHRNVGFGLPSTLFFTTQSQQDR